MPVLPEQVSIVRSFWLIVHADLREVARIPATVDFLVREVRAARGLLMPPAVSAPPRPPTDR